MSLVAATTQTEYPGRSSKNLAENVQSSSEPYDKKKTIAEGLLDMSLLLTSVTQLKAVISNGHSNDYFEVLLVLISLSIAFQLIIGLILLSIVAIEKKEGNLEKKDNPENPEKKDNPENPEKKDNPENSEKKNNPEKKDNPKKKDNQARLHKLNMTSIGLLAIVTVVNIFIAAFGIESTN